MVTLIWFLITIIIFVIYVAYEKRHHKRSWLEQRLSTEEAIYEGQLRKDGYDYQYRLRHALSTKNFALAKEIYMEFDEWVCDLNAFDSRDAEPLITEFRNIPELQ